MMALWNFNQARDLDELKRMLQEVFDTVGLWDAARVEALRDGLSMGVMTPGTQIVPGMLVHQSSGAVFPADQTDLNRWAVGVAVIVEGGKVWHSPMHHVQDAAVGGTVTSGKLVFLGEKGGFTFDEPTGGSNSLLRQCVGRAIKLNKGNRYAVSVRVDTESVV